MAAVAAAAASAGCVDGLKSYMFEVPLFQNLTPWSPVGFTPHFSHFHLKVDNHLEYSDISFSIFLSNQNSPSDMASESRGSTSSSNSAFSSDLNSREHEGKSRRQHGHSDSFSSMSWESLSMCTEGLGFESCDDMEENVPWRATYARKFHPETVKGYTNNHCGMLGKLSFPPPISCIGRNGKPWVCFKSYRANGRFILKLIRIPNQELLHCYRENGRFKMEFIVSDDDEILEEDEVTNDDDCDKGEEREREGKTEHDHDN